MSLPPADQPFVDEEEDRKRKAEIEEMMRWDRDSYFRNEPVQQEYRDVVTRLASNEEARRNGTASDLREPGPFDLALQRFQERKLADAGEAGLDEPNDSFIGEPRPASDPEPVRVAQADVPQSQPAADAEHPLPTQSGEKILPLEDSASLRIAQNGPLSAQPRVGSTDGVNRVDQFQGKVAKIRNGPLSWELEDQLNYAAYKTGLRVEVRSGGQPVYGRYKIDWIGSDRHDEGGAGDIKLFEVVKGKKRYLNSNNVTDLQRMAEFIRYSVIAGATGIGHGYMGPETIHVGGGKPFAWSAEPAVPALPWVQKMFDGGLAERRTLMKGGWNGLVDTLVRGRPLSLKPPQLVPVKPLTKNEREQGFVPPPRVLPPLY